MSAEIKMTIVNHDDLVNGCQVIIDTCLLMDIPTNLIREWCFQYLSDNIKINTEV